MDVNEYFHYLVNHQFTRDMLRLFVFVLLLQAVSYCTQAQKDLKFPDLAEEQSIRTLYKKNKVRTILTFRLPSEENNSNQRQLQDSSTFNDEGLIINRVIPEGSYFVHYDYNDRGDPTSFTMDREGKRITTYRYHYHEDGTMQSIVYVNSQNKVDSSLRKTTVEWINGKKKTTRVTPAVPGTILMELVSVSIEEYNRFSRQYILTQFNDEYISQRIVYDLDGKGAILRKHYDRPTSDSTQQQVHRYDQRHFRVESVTQFQNPKKKKTERMEYNEKGLPVTKTTYNSQNEIVEVLRYGYTYF